MATKSERDILIEDGNSIYFGSKSDLANSITVVNNTLSIGVQGLNSVLITDQGLEASSIVDMSNPNSFPQNVSVVNADTMYGTNHGAVLIQTPDPGAPIDSLTTIYIQKPASSLAASYLYFENPIFNSTIRPGCVMNGPAQSELMITDIENIGGNVYKVYIKPPLAPTGLAGIISYVQVLSNNITIFGPGIIPSQYSPSMVIRVDKDNLSYYFSFNMLSTMIGNMIEASLFGNNQNIMINNPDSIYMISPGEGVTYNFFEGSLFGLTTNQFDEEIQMNKFNGISQTMSDGSLIGVRSRDVNLGNTDDNSTTFMKMNTSNVNGATIGDNVIDYNAGFNPNQYKFVKTEINGIECYVLTYLLNVSP